MSWKLDNIDFNTYGVYVSKSSGVLDLPKIVDKSTDWLDLNGRDYWQGIADVKFEDREIVLSCWIKASGYAQFKTRVSAFFTALVAAGVRSLETPYGNTIDISLQQAVQVTRKGSYVSSLQIGVFTLRLTVSGDSQTKLITIYNAIGEVRAVVKYGQDAKLFRALQGTSEISFSCEFNSIQSIGRGDYIIWEDEKYYLLEYPQIDKHSTNKYIYRVTFTHQFFLLKDIQFMVVDRAETTLYATMEDVVDLIITNANRAYSGLFVKGTVDSTEYRNHQFNNEDCYTVLNRICSDYELEYEFKPGVGTIVISVKKQIGFATGTLFTYGQGNTLYKISRVSTGRELLVTRLYAYGSDRNIPASYGFPRLKLATEPVTREFFGMHIERTKIFDDIFPERTGTVTSYTYTENDPIENSTYVMVDSAMPFDLKEKDISGNTIYLISGTSAKIHFNSGALAGFEFEVLDYDHSTKSFYLVPFKEVNGEMYPNAILHPDAGDEYKILDINLPQIYIDDAEDRLQVAADAHIDEFSNPKPTYTVESNPFYNLNYFPGDTVNLTDTDFGIDAEIRISEISKNLYSNVCTITLSWFIEKYKRSQLALKVAKLEMSIKAAKLDQVQTIRGGEQTTLELKNTILNPLDEKFKANEIVRDESLDPRMLAYDAGVPQFYIAGAMLTENVDDDEDKINISAGTISITNWRLATKQREQITTGYNPTRTWIIPNTDITLATKALYYIYAKVDLTEESTSCTIEVDPAHIEVKRDAGYLMYKLGFISAGEE